MPPVPHRPPKLLWAPFRGTDAVAAGLLTADQLRGKSWQRLFRDVYANAKLPVDHLLRVRGAALLMPPGAVIASRSAAHVWGAKLAGATQPVEILGPSGFGPIAGLTIRTGALEPDEITAHYGIGVTSPSRTVWDLARTLPQLDAVAWIDALAHARRIARPQLLTLTERYPRQRGFRRAVETLALCDPRAESPPESRLRVHIVRAGLPPPTPQFRVIHNRIFIARVDLAWAAIRLAVEYDGQWHADIGQLSRDRERTRALNGAGWYVYPVTYQDMSDVDALVADIARVIARRR